MHGKCPYLSTRLECFAGSFGTARCFQHDFHSKCSHRIAADKKGHRKAAVTNKLINLEPLDRPMNRILDNLVRINF